LADPDSNIASDGHLPKSKEERVGDSDGIHGPEYTHPLWPLLRNQETILHTGSEGGDRPEKAREDSTASPHPTERRHVLGAGGQRTV
jgi:hypothetical protein